MGRVETSFQARLVVKLRGLFPGSIVTLTDPNHIQGIPDVLMLWRDTWAAFECKAHGKAKRQPNQPYYVTMMDAMSFAAFITPENEESVLGELQQALASRRPSRVSQRQRLSLDKLQSGEVGGKVA